MTVNKKVILALFFLFFYSVVLFGKEPINVRVAVLKDIKETRLSVSGPYEIVDVWTKISLFHGKNLSSCKVVPVESGLQVKNMVFDTDGIMILSKKRAAIVVNNRPYRGDMAIFKDTQGTLLVVNILDLESYIKGVLYHEISHQWPLDAIKAQAVAARTYAVYQKEVMKSKNYDLLADTSSQVYGGYDSEKHKTNRAVNFTHGEILRYQGKAFPAYFHATCGGTTEDAGELWKIDAEPLKGGRACTFCLDSPHYYWKATMDLKMIQKKLGEKYLAKGDLKNIVVDERTTTGRVRLLEFTDAQGESFKISAKDFRSLLGPDILRSTNFSIVLDQGRAFFSGKGWGHGVGLCQWGAYGMSRKGYNYKQILDFYYPGTELVKIQ